MSRSDELGIITIRSKKQRIVKNARRKMQNYFGLREDQRKVFELTTKLLTKQPPPKHFQIEEVDSSGDEESETVDPNRPNPVRVEPGAPEFVRGFHEGTIENVTVDYRTPENCVAVITVTLRNGHGGPFKYFPRIYAVRDVRDWNKIEKVIKLTCGLCAVPFQIFTMLD